MAHFVNYLGKTQELLAVERYSFLGVSLDRWVHFILAFLIILLFGRKQRLLWGIILVLFLIFLKEAIDIGAIIYYEPPKAEQWRDSLIDFIISVLGLAAGLIAIRLAKSLKLKNNI